MPMDVDEARQGGEASEKTSLKDRSVRLSRAVVPTTRYHLCSVSRQFNRYQQPESERFIMRGSEHDAIELREFFGSNNDNF
jgi:hypothetical protein